MTSFVIMNVSTENLYKKVGHYGAMSYPTQHGAKIACAKLNKTFSASNPLNPSNPDQPRWVVKSREEFNALFNPMVPVVSLMNGATVMIRKEDVGTGVDPSTERYWTM